jgi:hypothetical protein
LRRSGRGCVLWRLIIHFARRLALVFSFSKFKQINYSLNTKHFDDDFSDVSRVLQSSGNFLSPPFHLTMHPRGRRPYRDVVDFDQEEGGIDLMTADRGIYISTDGKHRREELLNVAHKKRRLAPSQLEDCLAEWIPVPDDGFDEDHVRAAPTQPLERMDTILGKRKEYENTVRLHPPFAIR